MVALSVEGFQLCGVGHAELDDQVVADVEVGQQGGVGNVDVGQTVAVDVELLQLDVAFEICLLYTSDAADD